MTRLSVLLTACGAGPLLTLSDVPITGASEEEYETAVEVLDDFDRSVGEGRLRIPEVRFAQPRIEGALGTFERNGRVTVAPGLGQDAVARVLRHELCHALDHQDDLTRSEPVELSRLVDTVTEFYDTKHPIEEVLAAYCEEGATVARALRERCPGEDPKFADMADWLTTHVWTGLPTPSVELGEEPMVLAGIASDGVDPHVVPLADAPSLGLLEWTDPEHVSSHSVVVSLSDGTPADPGDSDFSWATWGRDAPSPIGLTKDDGVSGLWWSRAYLPDGTGAGLYLPRRWVGLPDPLARALWWDGEGWSAVTGGCARTEQTFFIRDDRSVWSAWRFDEAHVGWGPVAVPNAEGR